LQADVAEAIVSQIQINLTPNERNRLTSARRIDPEAYDAYLKGRYFFDKPGQASRRKAVEYFRQAIEKDPAYAEAYSWLSSFYRMQGSWASTDSKESMPKREPRRSKPWSSMTTSPKPIPHWPRSSIATTGIGHRQRPNSSARWNSTRARRKRIAST